MNNVKIELDKEKEKLFRIVRRKLGSDVRKVELTDDMLCDLLEPVAPPQPSRPVLPPRRITASPAAGFSRRTFRSGAAPTTAPISICFAR